jgi:hypothetical protein
VLAATLQLLHQTASAIQCTIGECVPSRHLKVALAKACRKIRIPLPDQRCCHFAEEKTAAANAVSDLPALH